MTTASLSFNLGSTRGRSLSIFKIPPKFFDELSNIVVDESGNNSPAPIVEVGTGEQTRGLTCMTCSLVFESALLQRDHFRSDLHRVNARRKLRFLPALSSAEFNDGSASESSSGSDADSGGISGFEKSEVFHFDRARVIFTHQECRYSFWRCLLRQNSKDTDVVSLKRSLQKLQKKGKSCCILLSSGHFASVVFGSDGQKLLHKTFHRYTVRKKQVWAFSLF